MGRIIWVGIALFLLQLPALCQQKDTVIKKLDSLNKLPDTNNIRREAYNENTRMNVGTYFIFSINRAMRSCRCRLPGNRGEQKASPAGGARISAGGRSGGDAGWRSLRTIPGSFRRAGGRSNEILIAKKPSCPLFSGAVRIADVPFIL